MTEAELPSRVRYIGCFSGREIKIGGILNHLLTFLLLVLKDDGMRMTSKRGGAMASFVCGMHKFCQPIVVLHK